MTIHVLSPHHAHLHRMASPSCANSVTDHRQYSHIMMPFQLQRPKPDDPDGNRVPCSDSTGLHFVEGHLLLRYHGT